MSSVDPELARAQQGARPRVALLVGMGLFAAASFAVMGFFFGMYHDTFRQMTLNSPGSWNTQAPPVITTTAMALAGTFGVLAAIVLSRLARAAFSGIAVLLLAPLAATAGLTVGTALFLPQWSAVESQGGSQAIISGTSSTAWDLYAWFEYWVPVALPVGLAVLTLLIFVSLVVTAGRTRNASGRMARLLATGRKTDGRVSAVRFSGAVINGMPYVRVTTRFTDLSGTARWVVKKGMFPRFSVPHEGDAAVVWFDPLDPQNERSIAVGFGEAAQADPRL